MPLCQVNLVGEGLATPKATRAALAAALSALPARAPVIVLIHGYKFSPWVTAHDPHNHILSMDPRPHWKAVSWPRRLGLGDTGGPEPLCIAVGWEARGTLWQAYDRAAETGRGLAALVDLIRTLRPGTVVQVLAHSLGVRVALAALPHLEAGSMGRAILLAGAEMRSRAARALECPAGQAAEFLNVSSRENDLFDSMLEWMVAPDAWGERALGRGFGSDAPAFWRDLRIDDPAHLAALAGMGFRVPAADRRFCHWSVYLRRGLFDVYRAVLSDGLPLDRLVFQQPVPTVLGRTGLLQRLAPPLPFPPREAS